LEINQGTMHGQPIIKMYSHVYRLLVDTV